MKKITFATLVAIGMFASSQSWGDAPFELPADGTKPTDICEKLSLDAAIVMAMRQAGLPREFVEGDIDRHPITSSMIDRAYSLPIKDTEEESKQLVNDFSHIAYSVCNDARDQGLLD